ncbi:hypothetical protein J4419_00035 [Candidatus Woesearchaeota archaeon]|nr:hypothetical protein [Candidatus Woesearchaeota archaeon]
MIPLSELSKKDIPRAGGKAANLGELIRGGFQVPSGFCIPTSFFDVYKKTRNFPGGFESELRQHLSKLKPPFAVRSSATTEDLKSASFAGQHDTFLNVPREKVTEKVKACFSSLYTERAVAYRKEKKVSEKAAKMAVVVQEMVKADVSGVSFSLDPIHKKYVLIEVVKGLGEKLVSGAVTPNSYFLDRKTLKILEKHEQFPLKLDLKGIGETILKIEEHYKMPMDIEFSIAKGKLWILQARPITA